MNAHSSNMIHPPVMKCDQFTVSDDDDDDVLLPRGLRDMQISAATCLILVSCCTSEQFGLSGPAVSSVVTKTFMDVQKLCEAK